MIRSLGLAAALTSSALLVALPPAAQAADPPLKFAKPITLPAREKQELVAVPLDGDVYQATRAGLPDLRLLDAQGRATAFVVRKARAQRDETIREPLAPRRKFSARPLPDDGLEIVQEFEPDEPLPTGLVLVSPLENFEHRVAVELSLDGQTWQNLAGDALIFDYAKYIDVRSDGVKWTLPAEALREGAAPRDAPPRRLRITVGDVTQEQQSQLFELTRRLRGGEQVAASQRLLIDRRPFRIERIAWYRESLATGDRQSDYPLSGAEVAQDAEKRETLVTVDSRREPLTEVVLATDDRNFSRAARVEVEEPRGVRSVWRTLGSGQVMRIEFRDLDRSHLSIAMPETRAARYRLVLENRDSPPLAIEGLRGRGPVYEVVFLAEPGEQYRLAYGSADAEAPRYDTAALTASLAAGYRPLEAGLGAQALFSSEAQTAEPLFKRLVNDPLVLGVTIAALVILLGVGLYQAGRRIDGQSG